MDLGLILAAITPLLKLIGSEEARKYADKLIKIKERHDEELDKRSKGLKYSQLELDTCLRDTETILKNIRDNIKSK